MRHTIYVYGGAKVWANHQTKTTTKRKKIQITIIRINTKKPEKEHSKAEEEQELESTEAKLLKKKLEEKKKTDVTEYKEYNKKTKIETRKKVRKREIIKLQSATISSIAELKNEQLTLSENKNATPTDEIAAVDKAKLMRTYAKKLMQLDIIEQRYSIVWKFVLNFWIIAKLKLKNDFPNRNRSSLCQYVCIWFTSIASIIGRLSKQFQHCSKIDITFLTVDCKKNCNT
ncbi:hypothetical protein RFI_06756 [Reticulomyxa filosa]|uniref:Uncharacterized protein n=1 Tax=Reticulomyxa filosa TaxID=46433 RepID=X6NX27_RETFI|nr:hypothetical protein RFI_06756 [Reticulomyxa filosa]|eukprot:ETO30364.1 hypothetical protein RFI_06756 [Reticulomyxa filosa]